MVKIVKDLKQIKILMSHSMMSPEVKQSLQHSEKNIIDLDRKTESSSENNLSDFDDLSPKHPFHKENSMRN